MADLLFGHDDEIASWCAEELGVDDFVQPFTTIGIERKGQIVGGMVFNAYNGSDVELTAAGRHCWTRGIIRAASHYVFRQLKCERLTVTLRDERHEGLAKRLGFVREGIIRNRFGQGRDGILMGMLKAECRWID